MKKKKTLILALAFFLAFTIWTFLIMTADVSVAGQSEMPVGLSGLNTRFFDLTGVNMTLYTVTDWAGLIPVAVCLVFAALGLCQLVGRKSLFKVDGDILLLGGYYLLVIFCYLLFETVPINYRPILIDGRLEASYPSSTTLLTLSVMPTLIFQAKRRLKSTALKNAVTALSLAFSVFVVLGRLVSGVHWLTDIIGGALLSAALFSGYRAAVLFFIKE